MNDLFSQSPIPSFSLLPLYIVHCFFPQLFGLMAHTKKMESTTALQKHSYHPTVNTQNLPTVLLFTLRSSFLQ